MSAFEIAGSLLANFPVLISRAEQYKEGFKALKRWSRFRCQFIGFIDTVDLERIRFEQMLEGFLTSIDLADNELRFLMTVPGYDGWSRKDFTKLLQVRLGKSYSVYLRTMMTMENLMSEMQALLSLEGGEIKWANRGASMWSDQIDRVHSNFSINGVTLLESLESNNRRLQELLNPVNILDGVTITRKSTAWAKVFGNIRQHASILHAALGKGWNCSCQRPHQGGLRLQKRTTGGWSSKFNMTFVVPVAAQHNVCREIVISTKEIGPTEIISQNMALPSPSGQAPRLDGPRGPNLGSGSFGTGFVQEDGHRTSEQAKSSTIVSNTTEIECLLQDDQPRNRFLGNLRGLRKAKKSVRIDVVPELPPRPLDFFAKSESIEQLISKPAVKINDLCSTLRSSELSNICLGQLQGDEGRYHEVQSVDSMYTPQGNDGPITLEELLMNREEMRLSRTARYQIASVVASSLLQLETTPWLAGRLEKKSIMFYQRDSKVLLEKPYICHSFSSTKFPQTSPENSKTGLSARFATRDSLSSLGILLLELCFGETIESQHFRKSHLGQDGQPLKGTDYMTARDWAEMVREEEPALESVIRCCVFCAFEEKADWSNENFTQAVYANVVEPLEKLVNQRLKPL